MRDHVLAKVHSAALLGVEALAVDVEVHVGSGLPGFSLVGLPAGCVREGHHRIRGALANSGYAFPPRHVTVSLAPADLRKDGAAFDLPIAVGMLAAAGLAQSEPLRNFLLMGELGLDGSLKPVRGALSAARLAQTMDLQGVLVPEKNAPEAALAGLATYGVKHISEVVEFSRGRKLTPATAVPISADCDHGEDLADVAGQALAKRALEIAAAGAHNLFLVGPPGVGKTLLARRLRTILPPLEDQEAVEVTAVYSAAGLGRGGLVRQRPVRSPHHSISQVGLIGGGTPPRPGEISLAHLGVLFLDELPEFQRPALEALRQPLEEGSVRLARARWATTLPARTTLVAAMNPCPCGHYGNPDRACVCPAATVHRYRARVSGPLLDRIDLQVEVGPVRFGELEAVRGETSAQVRSRVLAALECQRVRLREHNLRANGEVPSRLLSRLCPIPATAFKLFETAVARLGLSARAIAGIRRVARTIADLEGRDEATSDDVAEAIQFRSLDREVFA